MKAKYVWFMIVASLLTGCKDNTGDLGTSVLPDGDNIPSRAQTFHVRTGSFLAEDIFARTNMAFLGKYTDTDFGTFEADFMTQFSTTDTFQIYFPEESIIKSSISASVQLSYEKNGFFGDPLNPCRLTMYELSRHPDSMIVDDPNVYYYTNINPEDYYNPNSLLGKKTYSAKDPAVTDSLWNTTDYFPNVLVPVKSSLGENIVKKAFRRPELFYNPEIFRDSVFSGIYVKCDHGDGTILYINRIQLLINADVYYVDSLGTVTDSILPGRTIANFASTKEVIQANRFQNNTEELQGWINDPTHTYFKTPAGIFTEATLPLDDDDLYNTSDSLNSAKIVFTNYNNVSSSSNKQYEMPHPSYLLMLRWKDRHTFFEKNKLPDQITSHLISHNSTDNQYVFNNISQLIITCINEKKEGLRNDPDWLEKDENKYWNKVVLIPVAPVFDSNQNILAVRHDLKLTSAKLKGGLGENAEQIEMNTVFTTFLER